MFLREKSIRIFVGEPNPGAHISVNEIGDEERRQLVPKLHLSVYSDEVLRNTALRADGNKIKLSELLMQYRNIFSKQPGLTSLYTH